jgi:phospholipid N-methyltransferase
MTDFTLFLGKFLKQGTAIASLAPSSRWLSRTTVRNIDWERSKVIVELGAGTGPITQVLAQNARPGCHVLVLERDPDFCGLLRQRFGARADFEIVEGDARDLAGMLAVRRIEQADHIVSGLPVPSFPPELRKSLFRVVAQTLKPEGTFNQITELPWVYLGFYRRYFEDVRFVFEPRNLPPAGAYFCRRVKPIS